VSVDYADAGAGPFLCNFYSISLLGQVMLSPSMVAYTSPAVENVGNVMLSTNILASSASFLLRSTFMK
jgi:hypothetical protein